MESTNTNEGNGMGFGFITSIVSAIIIVLMSVGLLVIGAAADAWADQLFICAQQYADGCRWYPGLDNFHDLEFQIWTAMLIIIVALNIVVWMAQVLFWAIKGDRFG